MPATARVVLNGALPAGVFAKDVILEVVRAFTASGCSYMSAEFTGPALAGMSMSERFVLANVSTEMGVKSTWVEVDDVTRRYADRHGAPYEVVAPDPDARYAVVKEFEVSLLTPMLACPHSVDNVRPVTKVAGAPVHQAFIGTCASGRLEDLAVAAAILRGRHVAKGVRLLIAPASREVLREAMQAGHAQTPARRRRRVPAAWVRALRGHSPGVAGQGGAVRLHGEPQLPGPHGQPRCGNLPGQRRHRGGVGPRGCHHRPAPLSHLSDPSGENPPCP